jgi:hypothetical protein
MMKMSILICTLGLLFIGCGSGPKSEKNTDEVQESESKPENFKNEISEITATFSSLNASDGEWDNGAEEETNKKADLKIVDNDKLFYCYDTQSLLKIEIFGSVYKASIEYIEGEQKTVILNDKDIDGSFIIFSDKLGQHGKLVIKCQNKILKEITIEAEGCL